MSINRDHLATQKILDLILDECRYWQGRDEARRGSFAILYAAAKEIAAQAQAAPEAEPAAWIGVIHAMSGGAQYASLNYEHTNSQDLVGAKIYTAPQHDAELIELLREALPCVQHSRALRNGGRYDDLYSAIDAKLASLREGGN